MRRLEPTLTNKAYQLTQELRLDFDDGGAFRWQIAGMYLYETLESANRFAVNVNIGESGQDYTFFTRYAAGWGSSNGSRPRPSRSKGGARLNYEDKEMNLTASSSTSVRARVHAPATCPLSAFADRAHRPRVVRSTAASSRVAPRSHLPPRPPPRGNTVGQAI